MATSNPESKKRLALAVIDFLATSLKDGTLGADAAESVEVAQSCIADAFGVDPADKAATQAALGGQSLLSIYGVYEKLKGAGAPPASGDGSSESQPAASGAAKPDGAGTGAGTGTGPTPATPEAEALKSQGNAAMQRKEPARAAELYTQAVALSPRNPIYLSNRAAAYSAAGRHAEARADAEAATVADPAYTKAWSRLGLARFALRDAKGSMEAYKRGIEAEGNGGSEAMKKGFETARRKVEEEETAAAGGADADVEDATAADSPRGAPGGAGAGGGGMPDLSALAGMFGGGGGGAGRGGGGGGGGGGPDLSGIMNNPMFASMAQNLMSNPDMMNNLMNNPRLREMAQNFGGGGGGGAAGGGGGGGPDLSSLMNDPSIAEMARNFMGGQGGRGAGRGT